MSISVYAVAIKKLTKDDFEKVRLYNDLLEKGYSHPFELVEELKQFVGDFYEGELISIGEQSVEIDLKGEGDVMYGDGLIIPINELPLNTVAIRIYAK